MSNPNTGRPLDGQRFVYHLYTEPDLAPPHGIQDCDGRPAADAYSAALDKLDDRPRDGVCLMPSEIKPAITSAWRVMDTHVLPIDDLREHDASASCWCGPTNDDGVMVHHSMDKREEFERGERRAS